MKRTLILSLAILSACGGHKSKPPDDRVPVTVATAQQKNMPVQLTAIGNVQPLQTVAVRALVGGQMTRVWFREGDEVRRGDMLFTIDPRPYQAALAQAEANLARDEAQLRNAEAERTRYAELVKKDYVTREDYDKIISGAEAAKASAAADRAAVETERLQLAYCEIRSPLDGRTGSLMVHAGNIVRANDATPLLVINQVHPVYVQFALPERDLAALRAAGLRSVPVSAEQPGSKRRATGKLTFVDNAVDPTTGTITLKATFQNDDRSLWPGQFVNVAVTLSDRPNVVVVPAQAVQTGQRGQYVYVVKRDNGVEMRPVKVGQEVEQQTIIDNGIAAGETVVTDGQIRLTPKSKVEIKQSL
ncbi:MAG TPA: efflux RND transporter periplasmic adaptor subunit [Thermoanaerobaculia bacterium]|nr:efflux RND transporter periplasmic adaptor subunit [Thermoanaerobaculia bacterium]